MNVTTDFQEWVDNVEPEDHDEVYSLYRAVKDNASFGVYNVQPARGEGERWIISAAHLDQGLLIASPEAKKAFLDYLTTRYCDDMEMEGWYVFKRAMARND